jgi:hypothetical protein
MDWLFCYCMASLFVVIWALFYLSRDLRFWWLNLLIILKMSFSISSYNSASCCSHCLTKVTHTLEELDGYTPVAHFDQRQMNGGYVSNTVRRRTKTCPILQTAIDQLSLKSVLSGTKQLNLTGQNYSGKVTLKLWGKRVLESDHVSFGVMWNKH